MLRQGIAKHIIKQFKTIKVVEEPQADDEEQPSEESDSEEDNSNN
jgi:hypothetical protein